MRIIGLLGGIASGKSHVAEQFRRQGAGVLDADRAGHEALLLPAVRDAVRAHFGPDVFDAEGEIDRKKLGRVVFGPAPEGPRELAVLEGLTHPEIGSRLREQAGRLAAAGISLAVLDAPVLLEAGWDRLCDALVFVDCPEPTRRARALGRGWTEAEFAAREAAQTSLDAKRKLANFIVDNSGQIEYTQAQIERIWHSLVG